MTARIAIVEDDPVLGLLLQELLAESHAPALFADGEAFLAAPGPWDLVLLDIEMPGLDGYETCRRLRAGFEHADVPVMFVSIHDTPEARIAAYKAGGDDFLLKPVADDELRHKVELILRQQRRQQDLAAMSSAAQQAAFSAMSTMGELGAVLEFMRASFACNDYDSLARALIQSMGAYGLWGGVQVRGAAGCVSLTNDGEPGRPLEVSILENMRHMGRIVEFRSRAVVNYEHASLLVQNLPLDDPDKVGRLRDHLALLVEAADARVAGLDAAATLDRQQHGIEHVLGGIRDSAQQLTRFLGRNREQTRSIMLDLMAQLEHAFAVLGLTPEQEAMIAEKVQLATSEALELFDEAEDIEADLSDVVEKLETLARSAS